MDGLAQHRRGEQPIVAMDQTRSAFDCLFASGKIRCNVLEIHSYSPIS
jgi:hypothetical protein